MPINNNGDIRKVKTELRNGFKTKRTDMPDRVKIAMDSEIQSRFLTLRQYIHCKTVFTYVSKDIEVDTIAIIRAAALHGKRAAGPKCTTSTREMEF